MYILFSKLYFETVVMFSQHFSTGLSRHVRMKKNEKKITCPSFNAKDTSLLRMSDAELAIVMQKESYAKELAKDAAAKQQKVRVEKQAVKEQAKQVADVRAALRAQRLRVAELEASADEADQKLDDLHAKVLVAEQDAEQTKAQAAVALNDADAGKTEEETKYLKSREDLISSYIASLVTLEERTLRNKLPAQFRDGDTFCAILDGASSDIGSDDESEDDEYQDDECQDVDEQNVEEILERLDTVVKRTLDLGELAVVCMRLITRAARREHFCRTCYKCYKY
jgi:hypothetical protein